MEKSDELKKLQDKNDEFLKLSSAKSDMVSISAHEIRTSLSALKWIIKMFLDGDLGKLNAEQESLMRRAYEGNERAIGVTNELLLANKTEDVTEKDYNFTEIDIVELINDLIFDFSGEARAREVEIISLTPDDRLPMIRADKDKIRVVLENILENAIKYSNPHGKIFITFKVIGKLVEVSIKNNGVTVSDEGKNKIFEKFYRDPDAQKKEAVGSGIGLFTTKKIVEKHNGKIWFESDKDAGTTFFFTIPIFEDFE